MRGWLNHLWERWRQRRQNTGDGEAGEIAVEEDEAQESWEQVWAKVQELEERLERLESRRAEPRVLSKATEDNSVRSGQPQSLPGQQTRRRASGRDRTETSEIWEGVL